MTGQAEAELVPSSSLVEVEVAVEVGVEVGIEVEVGVRVGVGIGVVRVGLELVFIMKMYFRFNLDTVLISFTTYTVVWVGGWDIGV